jgi:AbrB family looped-hinge helix DNA binding protein
MEEMRTTLSTKGQIVIPAAIREELELEPGTPVTIRLEGTKVILDFETLAAKLRRIKEMRGFTAGGPSGTDLLFEERRKERERELREEGW